MKYNYFWAKGFDQGTSILVAQKHSRFFHPCFKKSWTDNQKLQKWQQTKHCILSLLNGKYKVHPIFILWHKFNYTVSSLVGQCLLIFMDKGHLESLQQEGHLILRWSESNTNMDYLIQPLSCLNHNTYCLSNRKPEMKGLLSSYYWLLQRCKHFSVSWQNCQVSKQPI